MNEVWNRLTHGAVCTLLLWLVMEPRARGGGENHRNSKVWEAMPQHGMGGLGPFGGGTTPGMSWTLLIAARGDGDGNPRGTESRPKPADARTGGGRADAGAGAGADPAAPEASGLEGTRTVAGDDSSSASVLP